MKKYNKTWVTWFNKNKTKKLYNDVLVDIFPMHRKCRVCDGSIYYYDSTFRISSEIGIFPIGKSFLSKKSVFSNDYYLSVCEECLTKKFPEYSNKNKSRVFNQINNITQYAFNIPEDISKKFKDENYKVTKSNFIKKYGKKIGIEKWDSYKLKQAYSNSFEFKNKKYDWSIEDFKKFNKDRAVTLNNLIKRHGEEDGVKIWDNYIRKQQETKSKEYVVKKYGLEYWEKLCKSKRVTLDHFIKRYGKEEGKKFYVNKLLRNKYLSSKISGDVFDRLDIILGKKYKTYYDKKNGFEFGKLLSNGRYVFLDYYIEDIKVCIEYNGNIWHANPFIYKENDKPIPYNDKTSKQIWEEDKEKIDLLKKDFNIDTIIIWETNGISIGNILLKIKEIEYDKR